MPTSAKPEIDWEPWAAAYVKFAGLELTKAQFALELGVSQGQLSRYESRGSAKLVRPFFFA